MKALWGRISRRTRIWLGVGLAALVIIILLMSGRGRQTSNTQFQTSPLARGELTASVGATGTVRAAQSAVLNWQTSGTVELVDVKIGDRVRRDQVLSSLALDSVSQTVIQAQANLDRKSTRLNSSHQKISYAVFC